jgi:hypothetical protein
MLLVLPFNELSFFNLPLKSHTSFSNPRFELGVQIYDEILFRQTHITFFSKLFPDFT